MTRVPEPGKSVYLTATRTPIPTIQTGWYYVAITYKVVEVQSWRFSILLASYSEEKFYSRPGTHVAVHGGAIPIQQPIQGAKTGGITSGYPVRAAQPPQELYPPPPPGSYVSVAGATVPSRLLYTQPGRYLQREM